MSVSWVSLLLQLSLPVCSLPVNGSLSRHLVLYTSFIHINHVLILLIQEKVGCRPSEYGRPKALPHCQPLIWSVSLAAQDVKKELEMITKMIGVLASPVDSNYERKLEIKEKTVKGLQVQ